MHFLNIDFVKFFKRLGMNNLRNLGPTKSITTTTAYKRTYKSLAETYFFIFSGNYGSSRR
jgi:hypothetical protein